MTPAQRKALYQRMEQELEEAVDVARPDTELQFHSMFGGMAVYARGRVFALFIGEYIALKLSDEDGEELLKKRGTERLQLGERGMITKHYIVVPQTWRTKPETLAPWIERSLKFTATLPPPKARKRRV